MVSVRNEEREGNWINDTMGIYLKVETQISLPHFIQYLLQFLL